MEHLQTKPENFFVPVKKSEPYDVFPVWLNCKFNSIIMKWTIVNKLYFCSKYIQCI